MTKSSWKLRLSGVLALLLLVMTGCQAVQGYEIGQALQNSMSVTSGERSGTLSIELTPGKTDGLSEREKQIFSVMRNVKINIKTAKTQDFNHASVDAEFIYSRGTIPFKMVVDNNDIIFQIDGAKKPIVFHGAQTSEALITTIKTDLQKKIVELMPSVSKFTIDNAPNPNTISVSQATYQIHNENLNMQKLHAEIYGNELEALAKKFITSVLADEKGLKELLGQIYDRLMPTAKASLKMYFEKMNQDYPHPVSSGEEALKDLLFAYMDNKTLAVEFAFTTIQSGLKSALKELDKSPKDTLSPPGMELLLTNQAYVKLDLYIDSDKQIRKSNTELHIPLNGDLSPVSSIKITSEMEAWNINKPVTSDKIDLSAGSFELIQPQNFKKYMFLNNVDKQSQFYKLLKDDLQVTHKSISLTPVGDKEANKFKYNPRPFINSNGVMMVPARDVAQQFEAEVQWNEELKQLTLIDGATGNPIVLTIGSHTAHVSGVEVALESPAMIQNGNTFVPIRFISEALGAKLEWDASKNTTTITRD
jgi:hypothetical protein